MRKDWKEYLPVSMLYKGKYIDNWFSNMKSSPFTAGDIEFKTVEHFYQAMKCSTVLEMTTIASAETPYKAKKLGREVEDPFKSTVGKINPFTQKKIESVEEAKLTVMKIGLIWKFETPFWREKLLNTRDEMIIEWNNWGDRFWGVDVKDCKGKNHLGLLLMEIREEIRNKKLK